MSDNVLLPDLPSRIDVEPTISCNLACIMCQRSYWSRTARNMSINDFTHIYDSFPRIDMIKIQGVGEPLLNPDLFKMIQYSKQHGSHVTTYTNGSLLHLRDNAAQLLDSGIDLIKISIDGGSRETYESIRVNADFDQLISNILLITRLRKSKSCPQVELWTVGLPQNLHELRQIVDICEIAEIDTLNVQTILNTFDYRTDVDGRLQSLSLHGYKPSAWYLKQAMVYARKKSIQLKPFASKVYSTNYPCHRPFHSLFVSVEGYVVPCCTISDPSVVNMGNILQENIRQIWTSENYQRFRSSLLRGELFHACQNCYRESNKTLISQVCE